MSIFLAEKPGPPIVLSVAEDGGYSAIVSPGYYRVEGRSPMATTSIDGGPGVPMRGIGMTQDGVRVTESMPIAVEAGQTAIVDVLVHIR